MRKYNHEVGTFISDINDLEGLSGIESCISSVKTIKPVAVPTGPFFLN